MQVSQRRFVWCRETNRASLSCPTLKSKDVLRVLSLSCWMPGTSRPRSHSKEESPECSQPPFLRQHTRTKEECCVLVRLYQFSHICLWRDLTKYWRICLLYCFLISDESDFSLLSGLYRKHVFLQDKGLSLFIYQLSLYIILVYNVGHQIGCLAILYLYNDHFLNDLKCDCIFILC